MCLSPETPLGPRNCNSRGRDLSGLRGFPALVREIVEAAPRAIRLATALFWIGLGVAATAEGLDFESVGIRLGGSPTHRAHNFHELDGAANLNLPWSHDLGADWWVKLRLDFSLGWLQDHQLNGVVGTVCPAIALPIPGSKVSVDFGVGPAGLSRDEFITKDFGSLFQFTTHVGLNVDVSSRIRVGYRFQHMSNAGIAQPNPGLNLHMLGVSWLF
jgi:lipid A 3-O-deacylase